MFLENLRVPIPEDDIRVIKTGEVQSKLPNRNGRRVWTTIGKLPPEGNTTDEDGNPLMVPNGEYRLWYQAFYREDMVEKDPDTYPPFLVNGAKIGAFALFLGAVSKSGLYDLLIDVFGVEIANAILDLAMYYNLGDSIDLDGVDQTLEDHLVFSVRPHSREWYEYMLRPYLDVDELLAQVFSYGSDSWDDDDDDDEDYDSDSGDYEDFVPRKRRVRQFPPRGKGDGITDEKIQAFMQRWTALRQKADPRETVIHMDGTTATERRGALFKLKKWGVLAVCEAGGEYPGLPLAYRLYPSCHPGRSDAEEALGLFRDMGLDPKQLIAEASLLWPQFFSTCKALRLPWLIEMPERSLGHSTLLKQHEEDLMQGRGTPITARESVTALGEDDVLLFGPGTPDAKRKGFVGLYCVTRYAKENRDYLNENLSKTYQEACAALDQLQRPRKKNSLPIPQPTGDGGKDSQPDDAADQALKTLYIAVCKAGGPFYSPDARAWSCLKLEYHPEEKRYRCVIDEDIARYYRCTGGFLSLASLEPMDLQAMSDAFPLSYLLGDYDFAPTFSAMHTQLNSEPAGPFSAWFFVAYIADIVRALLMPSFRQFEAAKDGELRDEALESYTEEELKEKEPPVFLCLHAMLSKLRDIRLRRYSTSSNDMIYRGNTSGVRGAVLEAAGIQLESLPAFRPLAESAEDPDAIRELRKHRRTIPVPHPTAPKR